MDDGKKELMDSGTINGNNEAISNKIEEKKHSEEENNNLTSNKENDNFEIIENKLKSDNEDTFTNINSFVNYIKYSYYNKKNKIKEKEKNKNIIQEFRENKNILKDRDKLISFIEELTIILNSGNNTIIPFLDLFPILIISYIESEYLLFLLSRKLSSN